MLFADEIQTGFARIGTLFAMQRFDVSRTRMPMAKSLSGGMPLSGVVSWAALMDAVEPGGRGTYAGNLLACAAAHAVLDSQSESSSMPRRWPVAALMQRTW